MYENILPMWKMKKVVSGRLGGLIYPLHATEEGSTLPSCAFPLADVEKLKAFWFFTFYMSLCSCLQELLVSVIHHELLGLSQ